ncbi:MAG: DUF4097 family beta strand repeat protein [Lachnospiraceae bacterium]|nr:DUF4097 family beta strand repeat protein [Lachnospiraceae bacterium]
MTRREYMNQLEEALAACDSELRNEILADYAEHFKNGILAGKSEEEVCTELGDISEFISELPPEYNVLPANITALTTTEAHSQSDGANTGFMLPITQYTAGIDTVIIESGATSNSSANIHIIKSDDNNINIEGPSFEISGYKCSVDIENTACHIKITQAKPVSANVLQRIFRQYQATYTIYIPDCITKLSAASHCGDIDINNCNIATITFTNHSGDIEINNCNFDNLHANTSNGDIEASVAQARTAHLSTSNGDIDIDHFNAESLHAQTSNGDIDLANITAEKLLARSSNGDVDVAGSFNEITAASSRGDVDVISFNNCPSVDIKSSMGDVNYECKHCTGFVANCKTSMGDCDVSFHGQDLTKGSDKRYYAGDESAQISISTSMGDICLTC